VNPELRLNLGGVYFAAGDYLSAANQFRQATTLKPDYANARYNFALSLVALGELQQAKTELEVTKLLLPEGSEDRKIVENEIQNLASKIQPAQTEQKPTVEELTGLEEGQQQPPLTDVTEIQPELTPEVLPQQQPENTQVQQPVQQQTPQQ
jgi:tetratricopeptide (TPR) repeat protein